RVMQFRVTKALSSRDSTFDGLLLVGATTQRAAAGRIERAVAARKRLRHTELHDAIVETRRDGAATRVRELRVVGQREALARQSGEVDDDVGSLAGRLEQRQSAQV